ncbi:MAG: HEAT repeat domain-containing protein [Planctomycetes bacterium]|nr:HEAT repeat domain-containing protein [Planctomycetota bacterium]
MSSYRCPRPSRRCEHLFPAEVATQETLSKACQNYYRVCPECGFEHRVDSETRRPLWPERFDWTSTATAATAMGTHAADRAGEIGRLREDLQSEDSNRRTRAAQRLAELQAREAVPDLCKALLDRSWRYRWHAADALATIGDPAAVLSLCEALRDATWHDRDSAVAALKAIGDPRAIPDLIAVYKTTPNAGLRSFAWGTLRGLGARMDDLAPPVKPPSGPLPPRRPSRPTATAIDDPASDMRISIPAHPEAIAFLVTRPNGFARSPLDYELHLAAHEWSLASAISINSRDDFQIFKGDRKANVEPYAHQVEAAIAFFRRFAPRGRGLIADDVGLGKTITAGIIVGELLRRRQIEKVLVVCPKIMMDQWKTELAEKFNLTRSVAASGAGALGEGARAPIFITTYETASRYIERLKKARFDLVVLDEAHHLRNLHGPGKPPRKAEALHDAIARGAFRFVIQLTATPLQNRLWDVYSLLDLLVAPEPNPLGHPEQFAELYLEDGKSKARQIREAMAPEFRSTIARHMWRKRRKEVKLGFPEREPLFLRLRPRDDELQFLRSCLNLLPNLARVVQIQLAISCMSSPWAGAAFLEKQASTLPDRAPELLALAKRGRAIATSAKVHRIKQLVEELRAKNPQKWRLLVFTTRLETQEFIRKALLALDPSLEHEIALVRGSEAAANRKAIDAFQSDPPRVRLIIATDTAAEGVNLQKCNVMVNYDLPWNPMTIEQRIGRIQRLGQEAESVQVLNLALEGTVEDLIVLRLMEKIRLFEMAIGEMEEILSYKNALGEDPEETLQQEILRMILASLQGRDVSKDLEARQKSIEEARRLLREAEEFTHENLGGGYDKDSGPEQPRFAPVRPRVEFRQFCRRAFEREGCEITTSGDELEVRRPGEYRSERYTFGSVPEPDDLSCPSTLRVLREESQAFGEVVGRWKDRCCYWLADRRELPCDAPIEDLRARFGEFGMEVLSLTEQRREEEVAFERVWLCTQSVAHDQLVKMHSTAFTGGEKLPAEARRGIQVRLSSLREEDGHIDVSKEDEVRQRIENSADASIGNLIARDEDFLKFREWYRAAHKREVSRMEETASRTEKYLGSFADPSTRSEALRQHEEQTRRAREELARRFAVEATGDLVGFRGATFDLVHARALLRTSSGREVPADVVLIPFSDWFGCELLKNLADARKSLGCDVDICTYGHIVAKRALKACSVTGCQIELCPVCSYRFQACCVDSAPLCDEHSTKCVDCGRSLCVDHSVDLDRPGRFCPNCVVVCDATRRRLPKSEAREDAVTGRWLSPEVAEKSAISNRYARPDSLVFCEESGVRVLPDEIAICAVTGKRVALSLTADSAASGRKALRSAMVKCAETGALILRDETESCEESGVLVRREVLTTCAVTGKRVRPSLTVVSRESGKRALPSAMVKCAETDTFVLPDETERCEDSGVLVRRRVLATCAVSGKRVRPSLTAKSAASGKRAVRSAMVKCAETGALVLPDETERCEESGELVRRGVLKTCAASGKRVRPALLARSDVSDKQALDKFLERCPETGTRLLPSEMEKCEETGILVAPKALTLTGAGRRVVRSKVSICPECQKPTAPSEWVQCEETGKRVSRVATGTCAKSGKRVLARLLRKSAVSGKRVLGKFLRQCPVAGKEALPEEFERCSESGAEVLPECLATCEFSGHRVLHEYLEKSDVSGRCVRSRLLIECAVTGRRGLPEELGWCMRCAQHVVRERATQCPFCLRDVCSRCFAKKYCQDCTVLPRVAPVRHVEDNALAQLLRERFPKAHDWRVIVQPGSFVAMGRERFLGFLPVSRALVVIGQWSELAGSWDLFCERWVRVS